MAAVAKPCPKTGWAFVLAEGRDMRAASIDQILPGNGYTKDNAQVVCAIYNYAKHVWCDDDVTTFARAVVAAKQQ